MSAIRKTVAVLEPRDTRRPVAPPQRKWLESDGEPMDSPWHRAQMNMLITLVEYRGRGRDDFYVGGDMFIYYTVEQAEHILETEGQTTAFKGPDFFYIRGVRHDPPRPYWVVWEEGGRYPNVIVELLSPTTEQTDRTTKKDLYEQTFRTPEYFLFNFDGPIVEGWRLGPKGRYRKIRPDRRGWLWSEELGLWLGFWHGTQVGITRNWLRFYDEQGMLVLLPEEAEAERVEEEKRRAEAEKRRAEVEKQRAEAEKRRAEVEKQRAEAEKRRAEVAETELAQLRARLMELEGRKAPGKGSKE